MKFVVMLFLLIITTLSFGQDESKIDSLKLSLIKNLDDKTKADILNKIFKEYYFISRDSARKYADLAFEKANQIKYSHGIQLSSRNIAALFSRDANKVEELKILLKGAELLKKYDNEPSLIQIELAIVAYYSKHNYLSKAKEKLVDIEIKAKRLGLFVLLKNTYLEYAYIYHSEQDFEKSIKYYLKVDSIYEAQKIPKSSQYGTILTNLGAIKSILGEFDDAILYFNKAMLIYQQLNRQVTVHNIKESIGINEIRRENYEKALVYIEEAINYYTKNNYLNYKKNIVGNLGDTYRKLKKYENAEEAYNEQYNLSIKFNDSLRLTESYIGLGSLHFEQNNFIKAVNYFEKAKIIAETVNNPIVTKRVLNGLAESYLSNKEYRKAALTFKRFAVIQDSLTTLRNKKVSIELETKYQTEKKEQEIALLKSQNELVAQQNTSQRNQLLVGIGITTLAGVFFFFLYRNRQKTTKKLQELDKAKSTFFANISHEFRTPLTMISGPLQSQLQKENLKEEDRLSFEMMYRNSNRLLSLVDQILSISKIKAGNLQLKVSENNLTTFIGVIANSFTFKAKEKEINYLVYTKNNSDKAYFDADILEKIIVNLLSNAIKYTPLKGSIICNSKIVKDKLHFTVKNTGKGLSKNEINTIFERFYQVNENSDGVGIGLALVKELVTLNRGTITVESIQNEWTTFKLILPITKESFTKNELVTNSLNTEVPLQNLTANNTEVTIENKVDENEENPILLIVDDNNDIRTYVTSLFKDTYSVLSAKNGQEGIDLALEHIPDIIISDIMMPIKNGIELCNNLKIDERTSHIPIILLTAKAGEENEIEGIKTGADDYVTKPFNEELLKIRVEKLIENRKKLQLRYSQEVILRPKDIAISSFDEQFLERVQNVLDDKLVESSFSIQDFSDAVGMSRMQLHRKLKALTGLSASAFIRSQRLKLAAQLLENSEINVSQVGYSVGFNDHAYFSKCFKELFQCTPSEYIKKQ